MFKDLQGKIDDLQKEIHKREKEIDNPSLVLSMLSALEFFSENLEDEGE